MCLCRFRSEGAIDRFCRGLYDFREGYGSAESGDSDESLEEVVKECRKSFAGMLLWRGGGVCHRVWSCVTTSEAILTRFGIEERNSPGVQEGGSHLGY